MKAIATLRYFADQDVQINKETLEDLGFTEVLTNRFKLEEEIPTCSTYKSIIYIDIIEDDGFPQVNLIEARNIYGSITIGNNILVFSATYKDLLKTIELLKI